MRKCYKLFSGALLVTLSLGATLSAQGLGGSTGSGPTAGPTAGPSPSGNTGGPQLGGSTGGTRHPSSPQGVGGVGRPGAYPGPAGGGSAGASGGAQGTGSTGGGAGGVGGTGTPGGSGNGGGNSGGGSVGGPVGPGGTVNPGPGAGPGTQKRRDAVSGPLGIASRDDAWQNWWALQESSLLDLERRYRESNQLEEPNRDLFFGAGTAPAAEPTVEGSAIVRDRVLPLLITQLEHDHPAVRAAAVLAIGKIGGRDQVGLLAPMTKDDDKGVRRAAVLALGLLGKTEAAPYLSHILRDAGTQDAERAAAAIACGLIGDRQSTAILIDVLGSAHVARDVEAAVLYALGMLDTPRARSFLEYYLVDGRSDDRMRAVAVQALALHGRVEAVDMLRRAFGDADVNVRRSAAIGLGQLVFVSEHRQELDAALADLERSFSGDGSLHGIAAEQMENYLGRLRTLAETDERRLEMLKREVVELLASTGLTDADVMVRNFSLVALGRLGGPVAVKRLRETIKDAGLDSNRAFAALALGFRPDADAGLEVLSILDHDRIDNETQAAFLLSLGLIGTGEAGPRAIRSLRNLGQSDLVQFAAITLGLLHEDKSAPLLRRVLASSGRPELKRAMGLSLGLLGDTQVIAQLGEILTSGASSESKIESARALASIPDDQALQALLEAIGNKQHPPKDLVLAAELEALGRIAEKGERPILSRWFRDLNYLLRVPVLNEVALL